MKSQQAPLPCCVISEEDIDSQRKQPRVRFAVTSWILGRPEVCQRTTAVTHLGRHVLNAEVRQSQILMERPMREAHVGQGVSNCHKARDICACCTALREHANWDE